MIACPKCGARFSPGDRFCGDCGAPRAGEATGDHVSTEVPRRASLPPQEEGDSAVPARPSEIATLQVLYFVYAGMIGMLFMGALVSIIAFLNEGEEDLALVTFVCMMFLLLLGGAAIVVPIGVGKHKSWADIMGLLVALPGLILTFPLALAILLLWFRQPVRNWFAASFVSSRPRNEIQENARLKG